LSYDNLCKRLVEKNSLDFIRWLLSAEIISAEVVKTELSLEPIRADAVILLRTANQILLATLAKTDSPETLLQQVAAQVATIEETSERQNLSASVELLAGLRFEKNLIRRIFSQGMIRESVIYQEILVEGLQQGLQQGRQEGRQEGELALIFRLLGRKFGGISPKLQKQIQQLSISELEALAER